MSDFSSCLPHLLMAYAAYFVATASPGPSNLAIMAISASQGRRAGLAFALGVISGSMFLGILASMGLSAVLVAYADLMALIRILGGCYLLWLAFKAAKSALHPDSHGRIPHAFGHTAQSLYLRGLGLHLSNPKAILAWISIVSLALPVGTPLQAAIFALAGCFIIGLSVFACYAVVFSTTRTALIYQRSRRVFEGCLAGVFALAGLKLLTSR